METFLPFDRGDTYFGGAPTNANDGEHLLGQEYTLMDDQHGTGREVTLRAVRNSSTVTLYGKSLVRLNALGTEIIGVETEEYTEARVVPLDELLPSGGVAANDICFVVVKGPALCQDQIAQASENIISAGSLVRATTINAATTAGATGGRVQAVEVTSSVTVAQQEIKAAIGRAISTQGTSGANDSARDFLIDVGTVIGTL